MEKYHILFNPLSCSGKGKEVAMGAESLIMDGEVCYHDLTKIEDKKAFLYSLPEEDNVVLAGGDGTVSKLINAISGMELERDIYYYAAGTGNDFLKDIGVEKGKCLVRVNEYIQDLPVVEVKGKKYKFLNNVGFGIDGYATEEGDRQRASGKNKINYTLIALKGLLFGYKRVNATVTIDGVTRNYKNVWLAPTMNGRYIGGGMMACPGQDRLNPEKTVSLMVMFCRSKLKALCVFPSIFSGKHVRRTEMVEQYKGYEVEVTFDKPTALQIDGETISGVESYRVWATPEYRRASIEELEKMETVER